MKAKEKSSRSGEAGAAYRARNIRFRLILTNDFLFIKLKVNLTGNLSAHGVFQRSIFNRCVGFAIAGWPNAQARMRSKRVGLLMVELSVSFSNKQLNSMRCVKGVNVLAWLHNSQQSSRINYVQC